MALFSLGYTTQAFTVTTSHVDCRSLGCFAHAKRMPSLSLSPSPSPPSRASVVTLHERKKDQTSEERGSDEVNKIIGIDRGIYFLLIPCIIINIWFFTIPVEFRRTRICDAEESRLSPDRCMTTEQFQTGISDYYRKGK
jgi:hypothetical protein